MRGWVLGGMVLLGAWACGGVSLDDAVDEACAGTLAGDLVITEYLNDPVGTDTGQEYVELHNPTRATVDLHGLTLYAARSDGSQERAYLFTSNVPVAAGDYLVLGDVREGSLPAHVDHAYGDALGALGNTGGKLGVRCGERVVDEVQLTAPSKSGVARIYDGRLVPDSAGNDDPERWCDGAGAEDAGPGRGSPGEANAPCDPTLPPNTSTGDAGVVESCVPMGASTARPVVRPRAGDLVITEVMANPRGDDTLGEWVELLAAVPVDLNGLTVGTDSSGTKLEGKTCLSLTAGERVVLARRTDAVLNGGLPQPVATFGVDLRNSGGVVTVRAGDVLIDAAVYGPAEEGVATQVSASMADAKRNDSQDAWCRATEAYGTRGNLGTPGRPNHVCTVGGGTDGGVPDAGASDGGRADAGSADGGRPDAGSTDGGVRADAGTADGGRPDAGTMDGGTTDAGVPANSCIDRSTGKARASRVPDSGSLVLTEFMADPSAVADATGEWVEVLALRDVDLNGVTLSNESGSSTALTSTLCLSLRAGGRAVIARSEDASVNGGLPSVFGTFSFNLANSEGNRMLRLSVEGRLLDAVTWTTAAVPGVSSQVDPTRSDPMRNDLAGSFCPAPTAARYGLGDRGTPGMENRSCAL
ncbi:lamin tail domain-containing protein [Pyxidicoccus parkwayensis]|uniref:Lamin tail domain-containing protein n=1 Tax=Pyxidicoccus parkwayensis TaxID=2813578 RepID=A0ABX7NQ03_9BACT|nr:lamin tail domain-containing protein [Pyxidicoccus parkwaysis]QSQ20763.1 lamin tail domain-containing protein [Pyxidicoccus parkwaysis]